MKKVLVPANVVMLAGDDQITKLEKQANYCVAQTKRSIRSLCKRIIEGIPDDTITWISDETVKDADRLVRITKELQHFIKECDYNIGKYGEYAGYLDKVHEGDTAYKPLISNMESCKENIKKLISYITSLRSSIK